FFFSSRRRHTRFSRDWSSDVCSSDLQILAKYSQHFVDLNLFNNEPTMPHIPGGVEDFIPVQLEALGHMGNKEQLLALPYDNPTRSEERRVGKEGRSRWWA